MTNPWFRRARAARTFGVLLGSAVVLGALPAVTSAAEAADGTQTTTRTSAEATAFAEAAATGEPVEIL